ADPRRSAEPGAGIGRPEPRAPRRRGVAPGGGGGRLRDLREARQAAADPLTVTAAGVFGRRGRGARGPAARACAARRPAIPRARRRTRSPGGRAPRWRWGWSRSRRRRRERRSDPRSGGRASDTRSSRRPGSPAGPPTRAAGTASPPRRARRPRTRADRPRRMRPAYCTCRSGRGGESRARRSVRSTADGGAASARGTRESTGRRRASRAGSCRSGMGTPQGRGSSLLLAHLDTATCRNVKFGAPGFTFSSGRVLREVEMSPVPVSLAELTARHRDGTVGYLVRLLGDRQEAEDACQDAFLRAHRAFARLGPAANSRAWLYRIATRSGLNAARRRARRTARAADVDLDSLPAAAGLSPERREELLAIRRAVDRLPPRQRAALMLRP